MRLNLRCNLLIAALDCDLSSSFFPSFPHFPLWMVCRQIKTSAAAAAAAADDDDDDDKGGSSESKTNDIALPANSNKCLPAAESSKHCNQFLAAAAVFCDKSPLIDSDIQKKCEEDE